MKHIFKKISLEPYTSREDLKFDSYVDFNEIVSFKDDKTSNYGLIPLDVKGINNERITYSTMISMYLWMQKYESLLKSGNGCNKVLENTDKGSNSYKSAYDYYVNEIIKKTTDLEDYYRKLDEMYIIYSEYIGFIKGSLVSSMFYYKDVVQTPKIRSLKFDYDNITEEDYDETKLYLKDYPNCIDIPLLVTTSIDDIGEFTIFYNEWNEHTEYQKGDIVFYDDNIYRKLENKSIDENNKDYGSIYSKKYKEGYFALSKVLNDYDKEWYEKSKGKLEGNDNQWEDLTEKFFDEMPLTSDNKLDKTQDNYLYHANRNNNAAYSIKKGKIIFNPTHRTMADQYVLKTNNNLGFFYIDGNLYPIIEKPYILYKNNYYLVYTYTQNENLKISYCTINGKKIYSKYIKSEDDEGNILYSERFIIDNVSYPIMNSLEENLFISYQGAAIKVNKDTHNSSSDNIVYSVMLKMNNTAYVYNKIDGYADLNGKKLLIKRDRIVKLKKDAVLDDNGTSIEEYVFELDNELGEFVYDYFKLSNNDYGYYIENNILYVYKPYIKYNDKGLLSGITESKLSSLYSMPLANDNIGNQLPCAFRKDINGNLLQPHLERDELNSNTIQYLGFLFDIGNVDNLSLVDNINLEKHIYWGNIITEIKFYYLDSKGNVVEDTIVKLDENYKETNKGQDIVSIINSLKDKVKNLIVNENRNIIDELHCDIIYYMGAIINYNHLFEKYQYVCNGVKYTDKTIIKEKFANYFVSEIDSFLVKYYDIEYEEMETTFNEYSDVKVKTNKSYYTVELNDTRYRNKYNDFMAAPIFREEYKFGSSSLENIEGNIYIDRGVTNSFEKHLKLMEINSLESLEQYGNGFYNIIIDKK